MNTEQEQLVWREIVAESGRRRRRRRQGVGVSVLATTVAAAAVALMQIPGGDRPTRVAAGPPSAQTIGLSGDPRAVAGGPVASLGLLYSAPPCGGDNTELVSWMVGALEPYAAVDPGGAQAVTLAQAAERVPVPRDPPPAGACTRAVGSGEARAWELRAADGKLLGRGAGLPWPSRTVPTRLTSQRLLYHQERVASGQPFSGVIDGPHLDGLSSSGAVVLDVPGIPTTASDAHAAGMQILERLSFASVTSLGLEDAFRLPTVAPPGFTRCTANLGYLVRFAGTVVEFCDAHGRTMTLRSGEEPAEGPGTEVDINGLPGRVSPKPGSASVGIDIALEGSSGIHIRLDGPSNVPSSVPSDALVAMMRSVPILDARVVHPRGGDNDLRPLAMDSDRLAAALVGAGATGVTVPTGYTCRSLSIAPPTGPTTTAPPPSCPLPAGVALTVPAGSVATLYTTIITGPGNPFAPVLRQATGVETVAGIDVVQHETTAGNTAPRNSAQQAAFICGQVWFNFIGNDVFGFVRSLIPRLGC